MTEQLEAELRAALRERADQVPAASIARLRHFDYHPRTRRLRQPVAIGALASAAGTAGAVAIVISLSAGAVGFGLHPANAFDAPALSETTIATAPAVPAVANAPIAIGGLSRRVRGW